MRFLNGIKTLVFSDNTQPKMTRQQREIERFLAQSVDLVDLERRQRELTRRGIY